jgi:hypothetical protein
MMRALVALITVVLASESSEDAASSVADREPVVTAEDRQLASEVKEKKDAVCGLLPEAPMTDEEREAVYSTLQGTAGVDANGEHLFETFLREVDEEATTETNVNNGLMPTLQAGIASRTNTFPLAFLLLVFLVLCYHQICCRCCFKAKDTEGCTTPFKGGFSFCAGALAFAILISILAAPSGKLVEGGNRILCTVGEMADVAMSGVPDADGDGTKDGFPGFLDVCENVEDLLVSVLAPPEVDGNGDYVKPNDFVPQARLILGDTELLDRKLGVILSSLDRMKIMASSAKNLKIDPDDCTGGTTCTGHENFLLTEMGPKLQEVRDELATTLAGMLGEAKEMSASFLADENLGVLFDMVDQGMLAPLKALKEEFTQTMGKQLTDSNGVPNQVNAAMAAGEQAVNAERVNLFIFAVAVFINLALLFTRAPVAGAKGRDRYPRSNHCCAGCTWLYGWSVAFSMCILATYINLAAWPIASGCLVAIDLNKDTLANYEGISTFLEDNKLLGTIEACFFETGDGDLLGSLKVEYNNSQGEMEEISVRDQIVLEIEGQVDAIFDPLAQAPPADQDMESMKDLDKVLALLADVDAFYSYIHEAEATPDPFPTLAKLMEDTGNKAADYDPRAAEDADCTADPPVSACPALAARLRLASLACEDFITPPDSFEGQPDEPLPGLGYVVESINSYTRPADSLTTSVSCTLLADNSSSIDVAEAPKCKDTDKGLCSSLCTEAHTDLASAEYTACVGLCSGVITDPADPVADPAGKVAYDTAVAANPDIADGISTTEMDKHCPPIAALRLVQLFVQVTNEPHFECFDFDCDAFPSLAECAVKSADSPDAEWSVPTKLTSCKMSTLVSTFREASSTLKFSIKDVEQTAVDMQPAIATQLKSLMFEKMVNPFVALISKETMDCSFLGIAFRNFLDGACYNLGGALASYSNIFTLCAQSGFLLFFLMFFLWRHFINKFDAAAKEAKEGPKEGKEGSGGRDDPTMYCEHGVYTHDECPQCEASRA